MTQPAQQQSAAVYPLEVAAAAKAVQMAIRAALLRDVAKAWRFLDAKRLDETFRPWLAAMTLIVNDYRRQSALAAGRSYQQARAHALQSPTPASLIQLAGAAPDLLLERAFGYAGPGMLSRDTARPNTALSTTLGTAARVALDGGRQTTLQTVKHDPAAVGWYRVTDGQPCAFCALLASRGVVYKANTVSFEAHNDCGCVGAPAFTRGQHLPDISHEADKVYRSGNASLTDFRKAWNAHQASKSA